MTNSRLHAAIALGSVLIVGAFVAFLPSVLPASERSQAHRICREEGITFRLWGIDARELAQTCPDGWPTGRMAATRLQALTSGRSTVCQVAGLSPSAGHPAKI